VAADKSKGLGEIQTRNEHVLRGEELLSRDIPDDVQRVVRHHYGKKHVPSFSSVRLCLVCANRGAGDGLGTFSYCTSERRHEPRSNGFLCLLRLLYCKAFYPRIGESGDSFK
jgi:hypothetical protein